MASDKILIVDDDINILDSFRRRFSKNLEVHSAAGVKEGLYAVEHKGP